MNKGQFTSKNAAENGRKGGNKTLKNKGKKHYSSIGYVGGLNRWKGAVDKPLDRLPRSAILNS